MHLLLALVILAAVAWLVLSFVREVSASSGTLWQRMLAAAEQSATILWQKFVIVVGALTAVLTELATWLNEPSLVEPIKAVMQPQYVAYFTIFVALVTVWARRRPGSTDPIKPPGT